MFSKLKDRASSFAAKAFLQSQLNRAGEVKNLIIDSQTGRICIDLALLGESADVSISIENYIIHREDEKAFLEVKEIRSSKQWLEMLCIQHLVDRRIEVPAVVGKVL